MEQDEIYLIDLWRILLRGWRWFIAVLIVVLACTYVLVHALKPQWEATTWIQIGQVGQAPAGQDTRVEPLMRVIERLQLVPFQNQILASAGIGPDTPEARLYRKSLKAEPMPVAGPLVRLTLRARSAQQARLFAMATFKSLQAVHHQMEAAPLSAARARLQQLHDDLQSALLDRDRLLRAAASGSKDDAASKSVAGVLLASKNEQISVLQQQQSDLTDRLSPTYTYETSLPWPVYVPERAAFPNHLLIWGMGLLLGVFLGAFAATARDLARRTGGVSAA